MNRNNFFRPLALLLIYIVIGGLSAARAAAADTVRPQFRYAVAFRTMLDNLEDSWDYLPTRTIVGTTLTPMVGVQY